MVFGALFWVLIFFETSRHFPKMDRTKRICMGAFNATALTAVILLAVMLFMRLIVPKLFRT